MEILTKSLQAGEIKVQELTRGFPSSAGVHEAKKEEPVKSSLVMA
jgi:S-adenosylmethionine decarboxylase